MTTSPASPVRWPQEDLDSESTFGFAPAKRFLDVTLSLAALIATFPINILIALAIRLDSRGPIYYAQERVGLNRRKRDQAIDGVDRRKVIGYGRPIKVYKFRSMIVNAESSTGPVWALRQDPRATRVGRVLRQLHLDELPQFYNVLRGEMTIVGPRPERPQLVSKLVAELPEYALRTRVLPGITGLAQIRNGYDDSMESVVRKVQYDLYYMRNSSLLLDIEIMASTAAVLVRGKEHAGDSAVPGARIEK
jgi:lipopolysaccharide/colanic/teichoic acid biosynthesis glycosyltransferase